MKPNPLSQYITIWVINGIYYGFPQCCINEFVYNCLKNIQIKKRKFHGTGYVPCSKCNKKSKKEILKHITAHRKCNTAFPKDDSDK